VKEKGKERDWGKRGGGRERERERGERGGEGDGVEREVM